MIIILQIDPCPVCGGELQVPRLVCPNCTAELPADRFLSPCDAPAVKSQSPYDSLSEAQKDFLKDFLTCRGNLTKLQEKREISYLDAKQQLDTLLEDLGFMDEQEELDMRLFQSNHTDSVNASDIIRDKLYENGGHATVTTANGKTYEVKANPDGKTFDTRALPNHNYDYGIFDVVVNHLLSQSNYRARKGNGRNYRLGEGDCTEDTVVGALGFHYYGKSAGSSVFDPVFALAAILAWAGIVHNGRGYLELTPEYLAKRAK